MRFRKFSSALLLCASAFAFASCGSKNENASEAVSRNLGKSVTADIYNNKRFFIGKATLTQAAHGVLVQIVADSLTPGKHGMHFHERGLCEDHADGFHNAGGHIMPGGKPHGFLHPKGPHEGNLPNLIADENGFARTEIYTQSLYLFPEPNGKPAIIDKDGSALIIHAKPDDHFTQPIGGSGERVGCAVFNTDTAVIPSSLPKTPKKK